MSLNEEQQQQVLQLMEITQNQNYDQCAALLEAANGDFNTAVNLGIDGFSAPAVPTPQSESTRRTSASQPVNLMEELNQELVSDAAPQVSGRPMTIETPAPILGLILAPFKYLFSLASSFTSKYYAANRNAHHTANDQYDSRRAAARFNQRLEESIGRDHIELYDGSYAEALKEAKTDLRYLLVICLGWYHQDTEHLLDWLKDDALIRATRNNKMIVWGGSMDTSEAYQVALGFKATKYPFIALVGPSPKTPQSNIVIMEILCKSAMVDFKSAEDLANTLDEKAIAHEPKVLALRLDRERSTVERDIRNQQDDAYEQSLARDRARAEEESLREQEVAREAQRKARYNENFEAWRVARATKFSAGPASGLRTTRIQIRTAQGERLVAKFSEEDTIRTIYEYILCRDILGQEREVQEYDADFEPEFKFMLVTPMPRKELPPSNTKLPEEPSIWPNGSLIIDEEIEEGEAEN